ncbi:MAG: AmpG family muropeptide MFS transporter [Desulfobacterales bacterium]|nr:AmpG family muropeptide MFS transporter [Desulfobacterales bacterium]
MLHSLKILFSGRMISAFLMGFSCGLPLLLTNTLLQAWMKEQGIDLTLIGMTALIGLPYTLKFLWAPLLDHFVLPFLGRRRGWLIIFQIALLITISGLGVTNPKANLYLITLIAFLVTFFSASQDIIVDAYRRESLSDEELGLGSSLYVNGYRLGMLLASGGGLILADIISFRMVFVLLGQTMLIGIITTIFCLEPNHAEGKPASLREAIFSPIAEYFNRESAIWMLLFILMYKLGDSMASSITTPFYMDLGFTKTQIGAVVKLFGFWSTVFGTLTGGFLILRIGINKSLWIFGFLQAISTLGFVFLAQMGNKIFALSLVICSENFTAGMGTSAFTAFMASITNKRFTVTQYALLSSLMGIPRVVISAPTGFLAKYLGWEGFFIFCTLIAIPGMLLLLKFAPWQSSKT